MTLIAAFGQGRANLGRSKLVVWTGLAVATFALASCTSTTSDATAVREPRTPAPPATSTTTAGSVPTRAAAGPRYAVYGDSTGLAVAVGLDAWARENPSVLRETRGFAQLGCGLIELTRDSGDGLKPYSHECTNWPERWRSAAITANAVEPTSGVIVLGPWEVTDLTFPGDTEPKRLGDPFYDEVERSALTYGIDVLLEHSPYVVILTSPYVERGRANGRPPERQLPMSDHSRMDMWNALVRQVVAKYPERVGIVDYAAFLDSKSPAEDARLRPDGIHLTWGTTTEVARWLGPEVSRTIKSLEARAKR